ncbi:Sensory/regulatory protein RpfC [Aquisphaera giovannonii]|uniref:histidine kinase n=1 Tax=Aquisphaera giovannonii TaxID=406548 RepID=A0A5B9WBV3_9BACT|nr:ATP-binding protein [Aquisphaera giovannonii]QEH37491.1 Sensory/regulatory protein RpfC [Aquisphaera giovannonii]
MDHVHHAAPGSFPWDLFEVFTPRRQCMNFEADVIWLHFVSDLLIAAAYFSIPIALVRVAGRRPGLRYNWMLNLFALFIVLCGTTHLFNVWALWQPLYRLDGLVKFVTGVVSAATAATLWRLIPKVLTVPTAAELARLAEERAEELRASEATLRAFYDSAPVLMGVVEPLPDGDLLHHYDNRAACAFFGVAPEGTQGRRASEMGGATAIIREWLPRGEEAGEPGRTSRFERGVETPGGTRWLVASVGPLGAARSGPARFCYVAEDVTERRAAGAALRAAEERFEFVRRSAGVGFWYCDLPFEELEWDDLVKGHYHLPRDARVTIEAFYERLHPDDRDATRRAIERSIAERSPYDVRHRTVAPGGTSEKWIRAMGRTWYDADGTPRRFDGVTIDVTDEVRADEERARLLREVETERARLADVFQRAPSFMCVLRGTDHVFERANDHYLKLIGRRDVIGKPARLALPEVEGQGYFETLDRVYRTGQAVSGSGQSLRIARRPGEPPEELFVDFVYQPMREPDGSVGGIIVQGIDVTDRLRAEEALRGQERRFQQLAEFIPQLAWMARPDGYVFWHNQRWYEYTGARPEDVEGWGWRSVHDPALAPGILDRWRASIAAGRPFEMVFPLRGADGRFRRFLTRVAPFKDGDEIQLWFGTNTDIEDQLRGQDERERLLRQAEAAKEEAEAANRMKDEFLAVLSHELRTPLNAIIGWARILRTPGIGEEDRAEGLDVIDRNAKVQAQLIEDLLDISRIITGKLVLDVQRVDLGEVVGAALDAVAPAAQAKGIRITKVLDPSAGPVSGDPNRLQQVVWNLLTNAVKFTPGGGQVQVLLERVNSHVELSVIDTGQGIAPEFLPHAFDRFRQADGSTTRRHGGLGLGLSIVKQLAEMHGGSVRVKSPGEGQGSTFVVALPIAAVLPEQAGPARPGQPGVAPSSDPCEGNQLGGLRVLLVDDEPDARHLMSRVLGGCGADVEAASSVAEALDRIGDFRPDVLISDIGMPERDGYDLIRNVRRIFSAKDLPAAALTAFARPEDRMRAMRAGFQVHVAKPVDPEELVAVVATLAARTGQGDL